MDDQPMNSIETHTATSYPVSLDVQLAEKSNRWLALAGLLMPIKLVLAIPHIVIMYFLSIVALVCVFINYLIVIFTGKQNFPLANLALGYLRWNTRVTAWLFGFVDQYPPFELD